MTQAEALQEARRKCRKWGARFQHQAIAYVKTTSPYFVVGFIGNRCGEGDSWESAFADADRKQRTCEAKTSG